jgi:hypothetical protein
MQPACNTAGLSEVLSRGDPNVPDPKTIRIAEDT